MVFVSNAQLKWYSLVLVGSIEASGQAVKTPGRGFVLTRFLLPFHPCPRQAGIGKGRASPA